MKSIFRISRAAERDLVEIGQYTTERWGEAQGRRYATQLYARLEALSVQPELGRRCDDIRMGYWRVQEGKHVIFYRLGTTKAVEIIRVLHERMLPDNHL